MAVVIAVYATGGALQRERPALDRLVLMPDDCGDWSALCEFVAGVALETIQDPNAFKEYHVMAPRRSEAAIRGR